MKVWPHTLDLPSALPTNHSFSLRSLPRLAYLPKIAMEPASATRARELRVPLYNGIRYLPNDLVMREYTYARLPKSRSSIEKWREKKERGGSHSSLSFLFFHPLFFSLTSYTKSIIDIRYLFLSWRIQDISPSTFDCLFSISSATSKHYRIT